MAKTPGEKKAFKSGIVKGMDLVDEGLPGWFGTFADMMTLLFAFFCIVGCTFNNGSSKNYGNGKLHW